MHVFAMVTTRRSTRYTHYGIASLAANTRLESGDRMLLIDNDGAYEDLPENCRSRVELIRNSEPLGFAANVNQVLRQAAERKADVVFVNNDIIFSPRWFEPLRPPGRHLTSPLSNAERAYSKGRLECRYYMDLEDYLGNEARFGEIIREHHRNYRGYLKAMAFTFFAVKIPYAVYSEIGLLDETFGSGGGEDKDYCIRCQLAGVELRYALASYVLHFHGKSTWRGGESEAETGERNRRYTEHFRAKWGPALFEAFVFMETKNFPPTVRKAYDSGDYRLMTELLRPT